MSEHEQTLIIVRGTAGVGKSTLADLAERRQAHLVAGCPSLLPAVEAGAPTLGIGAIRPAIGDALPLVREAIGDAPYLLCDVDDLPVQLAARCREHYRIVYVYLLALPCLVDARRRTRLLPVCRVPAAVHYNRRYAEHARCLPCEAEVDCVLLHARAECSGLPVQFADTSDYPWCELTHEEARALAGTPPVSRPVLDAPAEQYQQAIRVGTEWFGNKERVPFEAARLDAVLPADMTGLTVLHVGASDAGFCFEAVNRGAPYCVAVESREDRVALARYLRTCTGYPITVAHLDAAGDDLPVLRSAYERREPYGLGLLLNFLHHCTDPEAAFRKVLALCRKVTVETPYGIGGEPHQPGLLPYAHYTHLPPAWLERIAQSEGFRLTRMALSPMGDGQRMIFDFTERNA